MDTTESFSSTVADMWRTRPTRIPKDQGGNAMVAGVCEGIGARYQIDPVVVRIAFVGLTLAFGGGIFVYLLMWMNMPRYGMTTSPWRAMNTSKDRLSPVERNDRSTGWAILIGLVIFFPSLTASAGGRATASLLTLILAAGALYLLHRATPVPPAGLSASYTTETDAAPQVDTAQLSTPEGYPYPGTGRSTPPSWDPLGTAPELWHLPDLPAETTEVAPQRRRSGATGWLVGLGIASLVLFSAIAATAGGLYVGNTSNVGSTYFSASSPDELRPNYSTEVGTTTLDLSELAPLTSDRDVTVDHEVGKVIIIPPTSSHVRFSCATEIGQDNCPGDLNVDASPGVLDLDVSLNVGDIEVQAA